MPFPPLEEGGVLGLLLKAGSHHDRLEALPLNGEQLTVGGGCGDEKMAIKKRTKIQAKNGFGALICTQLVEGG